MAESSQSASSKSTGEIVLYNTDDGRAQVQLRLVDGTVWLTQAEMAELFDATPQNIGQHVGNLYDEGELTAEATRKDYFQVREEGSRLVRRQVKHYGSVSFSRATELAWRKSPFTITVSGGEATRQRAGIRAAQSQPQTRR